MIGQLLNQYRLEEVVGQGGMGVVYRALDTNLERTVAVKILSESFRDDAEFIERFRQEAKIQAGLNHPNIATLFDFLVWNDLPVTVMEFINGETLRSMLDRTGPIAAHVALPIFIQALRGVAAGHKKHIIHRDLKPSNLMLTDEGIVKVTDFGIAKVRSLTGRTLVSTRVGSTSYMAPEQILGRPVDVQTDIYIMGGTLYELLTGRPPFQGVSQFEIDFAHVRDPPKPPTEYCPNIPPAAVDAIMRALAKQPSERFATAEEFMQALPDLHGVPYIATTTMPGDVTRAPQNFPMATRALPARPESPDATLVPQSAPDATRVPRAETALSDETRLQQNAPKVAPPRRLGLVIAVGGLLVVLIAGIMRYSARQVVAGPDHGSQPQSAPTEIPTQQTQVTAPLNTAVTTQPNTSAAAAPNTTVTAPPDTAAADRPNTAGTAPPTIDPKLAESAVPPPSQTVEGTRDLTGTWTGAYLDRSGRALLRLQNLQMQQVADGAITGHLTYKAGRSVGEDCTLDKSSYSKQSKRLRLIVHCRNPKHPKYLNVPLEFSDVEPGASSIEGGRLAFHLADDIVVTLKRTKGI